MAVPSRVDVDSSWPYLGIGINALNYYSGAFATADVVRESQFRTPQWGDAPVDADGAPTRDALMIFTSTRMGPGVYKLIFKGQASLSVAGVPADGGIGVEGLALAVATRTVGGQPRGFVPRHGEHIGLGIA